MHALVAEHRPSGYVVFDQGYVQYLTRFAFLATERPVAYVESAEGETAVFVPEFEVARVEAETSFARVASYREYPGTEHPMRILARVLAEMGIAGTIAADADGYPGILGYEGPSLGEVTDATVVPLAPALERLMAIKSEDEIELVRESARWCEHAHTLLQRYTRAGATEAQASLRAGYEASLAMLDALGPTYDGGLSSSDGASAGYRGQIGERSAWAHAVAHNIEFRPGDVLVTETSAPVWGYNAELERAMIVGPPTDEMRRHFDHMRAAQRVAFDALRPGVTCADVDRAVLAYFEENGILDTWSQHTGHAIGLRNHEAPFLDVGDRTPGRGGDGVHDRAGRLRRRDWAGSVTRTRSWCARTGSRSSRTTRATSSRSRSRSEGRVRFRDDGRLARTRAPTERLIARFPLMRLGKRVGDAHLDP